MRTPATTHSEEALMFATKTTCGQHRTLGYYFATGAQLCRGCNLPAERHETAAETVARKSEEAAR
jgi:hypothetical protein